MKLILLLLTLLFSSALFAVDMNFFGSTYVLDEKNEFGNSFGEDLDFTSLSKLGVNIHAPVSNKLKFHGQVIAEGPEQTDNWGVFVDYSFLNFPVSRHIELNFGRQIFPVWLASEYRDVGYELPYVKLPSSIASISPFKSINGLSFKINLSDSLYVRPFVGQENERLSITATGGDVGISYDDVYGVQLKWQPSLDFEFQSSFYKSDVAVNSTGNSFATLEEIDPHEVRVISSGLSYTPSDFHLILEYGKRTTYTKSGGTYDAQGAYSLLGYDFGTVFSRYILKWSKVPRGDNRRTVGHLVGVSLSFADDYIVKIDVGTSKRDDGSKELKSYLYNIGVDFVF